MLINIVTLYITADLKNKNNSEIENEKLKLLLTYNKQYIENADIEYQLIRKLRHDTKDVYYVIDNYLELNDIQNARKYIRQMIDIADDHIIFVNTQNNTVNAIINSKLTIAKSFGIDATCLSINEFTGIDDIDLCRLLSNMLENAITATANIKLNAKQINLKIISESEKYTFLIKNSIDESVLKENPKLHTTKTKFDSHGYGIKIIRDIAKKYNGHCDFYEESNMFCCLVVLIPNK
jgi:signal transduction histidine kinase regulating citrate/malate metabolism